ncbi:cell division protein ZapC domain-containing protein [Flocculibacter collagenilyticus]|uniref:cell division protein ZapC domain-containing protein n=1 Tax=Flocculibacter collagenilyticus TaxID=2744479 RepID=UPI0018F3D65F|nr:cell division protein ZapC domain-containing protein [Flocculibacter collagenilyticus]
MNPTNQWRWQLCKHSSSLILDMSDEMAFLTPYQSCQLTNEIHVDDSFNVEDANYFTYLQDTLLNLNLWSRAFCTQTALNATAVKRFYKPVMPKSWHFKVNNQQRRAIPLLVALYSDFAFSTCIVLEASTNFVMLLIVEDQFQVSDTKSLKQFDVIKVSIDRIYDIQLTPSVSKQSA